VGVIRENVHKKSTILTDEFRSYRGIGSEFTGGHKTVRHGKGEYVRGDVYTNTAESWFALLKRGVFKGHFTMYPENTLGDIVISLPLGVFTARPQMGRERLQPCGAQQ